MLSLLFLVNICRAIRTVFGVVGCGLKCFAVDGAALYGRKVAWFKCFVDDAIKTVLSVEFASFYINTPRRLKFSFGF